LPDGVSGRGSAGRGLLGEVGQDGVDVAGAAVDAALPGGAGAVVAEPGQVRGHVGGVAVAQQRRADGGQ
jgi:hypothetical protein